MVKPILEISEQTINWSHWKLFHVCENPGSRNLVVKSSPPMKITDSLIYCSLIFFSSKIWHGGRSYTGVYFWKFSFWLKLCQKGQNCPKIKIFDYIFEMAHSFCLPYRPLISHMLSTLCHPAFNAGTCSLVLLTY